MRRARRITKASTAILILAGLGGTTLHSAAHADDVQFRWEAPQYDVAGAVITEEMVYQIFIKQEGDSSFSTFGDEVETTSHVAVGMEGCFDVYVTAIYRISRISSSPSNEVSHCVGATSEPPPEQANAEPLAPGELRLEVIEGGTEPEPEPTPTAPWWEQWRNR